MGRKKFMFKYYLCFFLSVAISSLSQVLLKKSAVKKHSNFIMEYLNPYVVIGYGMFFGAMLLNILGYRQLDYINGPIIGSLGYIFVMILGLLFFNEKITPKKFLGVAFIFAGILVFYMNEIMALI
jgi:drug/metabolite transporter (DMT)-like permease